MPDPAGVTSQAGNLVSGRNVAEANPDQDPPHRFRGGVKKVCAIRPLDFAVADQAQVRFVHQRRRLKCMTRPLGAHAVVRQFAKFIVNQRKQLPRGMRIALACRCQQSRHF